MSFNIHSIESIKPNSWLLQSSNPSKLWAGRNVDARADSFFEGAWAGAFNEFKFAECADVFASGAVNTSDGWLVISPSHTLEVFYLAKFSAEGFAYWKLGVRTQWLSKIVWWVVFRRRPWVIWKHSDPFNILALEWALSVVGRQYELPEPSILETGQRSRKARVVDIAAVAAQQVATKN